MNVSAPFIHRPVMCTVLVVALLVFGLFSYSRLPVSELPNVDFPTINVSASLPGANPRNMASSIATPLERRFGSIAGLISMSSTSSTGSASITLQFDLSRNIDAAAADVQMAISQSLRQLPPTMPSPPTLSKVNPADYGIMYIALTANGLPLTQLDEYAETRVAARIAQVPGVAQVLVFGSYKYAARIYLNPYALAARGLTLDMVSGAIQANNANLPTGTLFGDSRTYTVESNGQLANAQAYDQMIVAYRNGAPIHLSDIGYAIDGIQQDRQLTTFTDVAHGNGKMLPAVMLSVKRQAGANTVAVSQAVNALMPELTRQAPGDTVVHLLYSRADFIQGSIAEVRTSLFLAIGLVAAVIFVFLRNWRATLISALALPTSIIGTFAIMRIAGFNVDSLSLMALTLAVGFVVDDAIVVLENIVRYRERGESALRAALKGSKEIAFTVTCMTLSLVAVFIPILFMGGIVGRLFSEFAMTVSIAILLSGLISLTFTPMLCSRFLGDHAQPGALHRALDRSFDYLRERYRMTLTWAVDHWGTMLGAGGLILALTFVLFAQVRRGFIPSEDTGQVIGTTLAPEGTTFDQLNSMQQQVAKIVQANPAIATVMSNAGQGWGSTGGNNVGLLYMGLRPMSERRSADEVRQQLRQATASQRGLQTYIENPSAVNVGTVSSNAQYQYELQSSDIESLYKAAPQFERLLGQIPGIQDVSSDLTLNNPQISVNVRREMASTLGVTVQQVQSALSAAYGGQQVSTIFGPANEYWVMMQLAPKYQTDIGALDALYVQGTNKNLVPLRAVAEIVPSIGPLSVSHYSQLPSVTLSFNLAPDTALGEVTGRVEALAQKTLGAEVSGTFVGNAQTFKQSMVDMPLLLLTTVFVIYMVLAVLYESFSPSHHPDGPPAGNGGRLVVPAVAWPGAQYLQLRRSRVAGGARQKERHHHGGLRVAVAPRAGPCAARGYHRGVFGALPSDHDDHHGRHSRHAAHRTGRRYGRRGAPAAGNYHRRRAGAITTLDALHHARVLRGGRASSCQAYCARYFRGLNPNWPRKRLLKVDRSLKPASKLIDVTESDEVARRSAARRILKVNKN
jgi:hydrophobic/amphiphilic exporter-1 (mainly G- bacteria), HAE1 family